ncbi:hypothetical protein A7982_12315 [Minicystis rosea]|nr:hypothetical protein A7982_12315 [Minicystis rosea]
MPPAPPGDGANAQVILRELAEKAAKDADAANVMDEPIKSAKRALERAHGARVSGNDAVAHELDALALAWAEAARDLERAAAAERVATVAAQKANEVQTKVERARALLEETQARRGRAAAELARAEADAKEAARGAGDAEAQRIEAAKKKGGKAPAAAPKGGAAKGKPAGKGGK